MCDDYDYYLFQKISYPSLIVIDNFSVPMCDDYDYYLFQKKSYPSLIPRRKLVQKTFNDGKLKLQCIPKKGKAKVNDLLYYKKTPKLLFRKDKKHGFSFICYTYEEESAGKNVLPAVGSHAYVVSICD